MAGEVPAESFGIITNFCAKPKSWCVKTATSHTRKTLYTRLKKPHDKNERWNNKLEC